MNEEELIEVLASIEHERWAKWQAYLHSKCVKNEDGSLTIPNYSVWRWEKLIVTSYCNLNELEKNINRKEVMSYFTIIRDFYFDEIIIDDSAEAIRQIAG